MMAITRAAHRQASPLHQQFLKRRLLRIYPMYWVVSFTHYLSVIFQQPRFAYQSVIESRCRALHP